MGVEVLAAGALIGGAVSAVGSIKRGNAARKAAEYNAKINERNARETEQQAIEQEKIFRIQASKQIGSFKAARGASGVRLGGSAIDALQESFFNIEADANNIKEEGARKARAYREGANLDRMEGQAAQNASRFSAAGTLLSSTASAFTTLNTPAPDTGLKRTA